MRRYTDSLIAGSRSTRLRRTSRISTPTDLAYSLMPLRMACITCSRSPATTSATVRLPNSSRATESMRWVMRSCAPRTLPPKATKNLRGSVMRHLTNQSTTMLFFSAVRKRSLAATSMVCRRRSMKTTFWNGGGSLKCRPGSRTTCLISPKANTTAYWRWSTTNSIDDSTASRMKKPIAKEISRFMTGLLSASRGHGCAAIRATGYPARSREPAPACRHPTGQGWRHGHRRLAPSACPAAGRGDCCPGARPPAP
ncbi:hypothetical protein D9M72_425440 [compost metagenome]